MRHTTERVVLILMLAVMFAAGLSAADPFFLRRSISDIQPKPDDLTLNAKAASYKPIFGVGDADAAKLVGVARYGELTVGPGGSSAVVSFRASSTARCFEPTAFVLRMFRYVILRYQHPG